MNFATYFKNPTSEWRGKPFWSWNGKLEKNELIRQIHILKEMGMGGYFMHSRTGLVTEYLGKEWFDLTNACAEEGEKLGMESWLYDEDRWPSGTAGGIVTENPEYQMKFIHLAKFAGEEFNFTDWESEEERPLGAWSCTLKNRVDIYDVTPLTKDTPAEEYKEKTVLAFHVIPMASSSFYNGNTYVDTMKKEATDEYIRITHEKYKEHCGEYFGNSIKGIFTDEPHRGAFMSGFGNASPVADDGTYMIPWTDKIFDTFADNFGSRVEEDLPALFLRKNGKEVNHIKAQYSETMLSLFLENFLEPCYDWCEKNDLQLTGHVLHENNLSSQVSTNGSVQRCYPLMHVPGIDYLCEFGREYWVAKQVDSAARQFNQQWILSELYGCTGWQMNFESHKAIGAWQALFGVNLRCHHLSWYTMEGEAKRDYPASILHQSPWYKEYNTVETWFSRLGYFRAQGEPCCDLLVLNPVESVWGRVYPGAIQGMSPNDKGIKNLEDKYAKLFHILAGNQIDFDYGDEALLAEHGGVNLEDESVNLYLGEMKYTTVLVAGVETIRSSTLDLLNRFVEAGGKVLFAGTPPAYIDSLISEKVEEFAKLANQRDFEEKEIVESLNGHTQYQVEIKDASTGEVATDVFCQLRKSDDEFFLTTLNTDRDNQINLNISFSGINCNSVEEWNLDSGEGLAIQVTDNPLSFETSLNTSQARCFKILKESEFSIADSEQKSEKGDSIFLDGTVTYTLAEKNICVLDTPSWSLNDEEELPQNDILQIDKSLRKKLEVPVRGGDMVQPWFRKDEDFPVLGNLNLKYPLNIEKGTLEKIDELHLVMETPELFKLVVNGKNIDNSNDDGYWVDTGFRRIRIPVDTLNEGANEFTINCEFRENINLEAMYLMGNFAVTLNGIIPTLSPMPEKLMPESVVEQGFPFYSDSITYQYDVPEDMIGKNAIVRVPSYEGAYLKISSNGEQRMIPWRPNETTLKLGKTLDIEICVTRKNTFGPLHLKDPRPRGTSPGSFVPSDNQFSLDYVFIESGLLSPIELVIIQ